MEALWDTGLVVLGAVLLGILLILAFRRPRKEDILRDATRDIYASFDPPDTKQLEGFRKRFTGARPELAAPYAPPRRAITFTPRQLERVNIQRRLRGVPLLSKRGFQGAAAKASTDPRRPETHDDWINYFIFYQVFFADHTTARASCDHHFTVNPDLPFNGQGGSFGGAGASGAWDPAQATQDPAAGNPSPAAALGAGAAIGAAAYLADRPDGPLVGDGPGADRAYDPIAIGDLPSGAAMGAFLKDGDYSAPRSEPMPEPAPQARPEPYYEPPSRPEPSSSYSSSSESSSSSSSYDSGSSSGGGDSGGGGGGGD